MFNENSLKTSLETQRQVEKKSSVRNRAGNLMGTTKMCYLAPI